MFGSGAEYRDRSGLIAHVAVLAATALVVYALASLRSPYQPFLKSIIVYALGSAALAWAAAFGITAALYMGLPGSERGPLGGRAFKTAAVAVWFAPSIILLSRASGAAALPALVLVVTASRMLYAEWEATGGPRLEPPPPEFFGSAFLRAGPMARDLLPAIGAAAAAQLCISGMLLRNPKLAAIMLAAAASTLTIQSLRRSVWQPGPARGLPTSPLAAPATILLAASFTVGGLAPQVWTAGRGGDGAGSATRSGQADRFAYPTGPGERPEPISPEPADVGPDGGYPGVIIWPLVKPVVSIVAPLPPGGLTANALARP